jgi:hypothetical protein
MTHPHLGEAADKVHNTYMSHPLQEMQMSPPNKPFGLIMLNDQGELWLAGSSETKKDTAQAASCNLHVDFTKCPPDHSIPACCSKGGALDCIAVESAVESASALAYGRASEDDLPSSCAWWAGPRKIRSCCAIP